MSRRRGADRPAPTKQLRRRTTTTTTTRRRLRRRLRRQRVGRTRRPSHHQPHYKQLQQQQQQPERHAVKRVTCAPTARKINASEKLPAGPDLRGAQGARYPGLPPTGGLPPNPSYFFLFVICECVCLAFLPRDALLSAVYTVVVCLCVCVCVRHTPVLYQNG